MQHEVDGPVLMIHQHAVTDPEAIRRAMAAALADPALQPGSHLLWDASEAPPAPEAQTPAPAIRLLRNGVRVLAGVVGSWSLGIVAGLVLLEQRRGILDHAVHTFELNGEFRRLIEHGWHSLARE